MTDLTKEQCEKFLENPRLNPLTGRKIEKGKGVYNKLMVACMKRNNSSSLKKPKNFPAPAMGPMMHWRLNAKDDVDRQNNMIKFLRFIQTKLKDYDSSDEPVSKMQIEEFVDILEEAHSMFQNNQQYTLAIMSLIKKTKAMQVSKQLVDDTPKYEVVADMEIKPKRRFIRAMIFNIYTQHQGNYRTMLASLKGKKIYAFIGKTNIKDCVDQKKYLDHIIKHNIFTHDDIYKHTFSNENIYEDLKKLHIEYSKLYKEINGKSP